MDQYDLGMFRDERYVHEIEVDNVAPVNQPPMRMTLEQEKWVSAWTEEQL